jgi:hypothetical protein
MTPLVCAGCTLVLPGAPDRQYADAAAGRAMHGGAAGKAAAGGNMARLRRNPA